MSDWDSSPKTYLHKHAAGYPSGTGSATTLNMTDEDKKEAEKRKKHPLGFAPPACNCLSVNMGEVQRVPPKEGCPVHGDG